MASILALAAVAVVAGARSFAAIGEWAADAPQHVLALLDTRLDPVRAAASPPTKPPRAESPAASTATSSAT
ncbi:hypothetical protein [Amycolatopsis sp. NPDC001319]|uniref:hypothetical protein n=1 Tax=unclassified Amycolatopsis TaxID=2618356 RepID=UPI003698AE71